MIFSGSFSSLSLKIKRIEWRSVNLIFLTEELQIEMRPLEAICAYFIKN